MERLYVVFLFFFALTLNSHTQSISINNIDRTNYPIIKGEIIPYDFNGKRISNMNKNEWIVYENDKDCPVLSIDCPEARPKTIAISSVLALDISGSMANGNRLNIAKEAAAAWVNSMNSESECALTTFSSNSYEISDFSNDKEDLKEHISDIQSDGDITNFNQAFTSYSGSLFLAKSGANKRVLVFLSDGEDTLFTTDKAQQIIKYAIKNHITIYCLTIDQPCPKSLQNISEQTGGEWYDFISTGADAKNLYLSILQVVQQDLPCIISWRSVIPQNTSVDNMQITSQKNGIDMTFDKQTLYDLSKDRSLGRTVYHDFGKLPEGKGGKIKLRIKAVGDISLSGISLSGSETFSLEGFIPFKVILSDGEELCLTINYAPLSDEKVEGKIEIKLSNQTVYTVIIEGGEKILSLELK